MKKKFPEPISHKISETNSSFHVKWEKFNSVFQEFSSSINKTFILSGGLGTRLSFYEVFFLVIPSFLRS